MSENITRLDLLKASAETELELVKSVLRFLGIGFTYQNGVLTILGNTTSLHFDKRGNLNA